jgi:hypothetical protein
MRHFAHLLNIIMIIGGWRDAGAIGFRPYAPDHIELKDDFCERRRHAAPFFFLRAGENADIF